MKIYTLLSLLLISSFVSAGRVHRSPWKTGKCNKPTQEQWNEVCSTPLTTAIANQNIPEVARLLDTGADPNERNSAGCTPLCFTRHRLSILTKLLLEHKANPNAYSMVPSMDHWRELDCIMAFGTEEQVKLLLEYGADPFQIRKPGPLKPNEKEMQNIKLVQAERRSKRWATLILCAKEIDVNLPSELVAEIYGLHHPGHRIE